MNICKQNPVVLLERLNIDTNLRFISAASVEQKCAQKLTTQSSKIKSGASAEESEVDTSLPSSSRQNTTQNSETKDLAVEQVVTSSSTNLSNNKSDSVESSSTSVDTEEVQEPEKSCSLHPVSSLRPCNVIVKDVQPLLKTINCAPVRKNGVVNTLNNTEVPSSLVSSETVSENPNRSLPSNVYYDRNSIKLRDVRVILVDIFPNRFNSKSKRRLTTFTCSKASSQNNQHSDKETNSVSDYSWSDSSDKCGDASLTEHKSRLAVIRSEQRLKNRTKTCSGLNNCSEKNRVRYRTNKTPRNQAEISSRDNEGSFNIPTGPIKLFRNHSGNWQIKEFSLENGARASWNMSENQAKISSNIHRSGFEIFAETRSEHSLKNGVGTNCFINQRGLGNQSKREVKKPPDRTLKRDRDQSPLKPLVYQGGKSGTIPRTNGLSHNTVSVLRSFRTPSKIGRRKNDPSFGNRAGINGFTNQHSFDQQAQTRHRMNDFSFGNRDWISRNVDENQMKISSNIHENSSGFCRETCSKMSECSLNGAQTNRNMNPYSLSNRVENIHRMNDHSSGNGVRTSSNMRDISSEAFTETSSDLSDSGLENTAQIIRNVNLNSASNHAESSRRMNDHSLGNRDWTRWNMSENQVETDSSMNEDGSEIFVETSSNMNEYGLGSREQANSNVNLYGLGDHTGDTHRMNDHNLGNGDWTSWNVSENQVEMTENSPEFFADFSSNMNGSSSVNGAPTDENMNQYILGNPAEINNRMNDFGFENEEWTSWNENENQVETNLNINDNNAEIFTETSLDMNECIFKNEAKTDKMMDPLSLGNHAETYYGINDGSFGNGDCTNWNVNENPAESWPNICGNNSEISTVTSSENLARTNRNMNQLSSGNLAESSGRMADPSSDKSFYCSLCPARFNTSRSLHFHVKTHNIEKPFPCPVCGVAFSQAYRMKEHLLIHSDDRPYRCIHCSKMFKSKRCLNSHVRRMHSQGVSLDLDPARKTAENPRRPTATDTGVAARCLETQKHSEQKTMRSQPLISPTQLENQKDARLMGACSLQNRTNKCDSEYQEDASLSNGGSEILAETSSSCSNRENGDKMYEGPYPCQFCSKTFESEAHRDTHLHVVHSDEGQFFCEFCPGSKSIHSAKDSLKCPECPKTFSSKGAVNQHFKKHCGNKFLGDTYDSQPLVSQTREDFSAATSPNLSASTSRCSAGARWIMTENSFINGCSLENPVGISQNVEESAMESQFADSWITSDCGRNLVTIGVSVSESENNWVNGVACSSATNQDSSKGIARVRKGLENHAGIIPNLNECFQNQGTASSNNGEECLEILAETGPHFDKSSVETGEAIGPNVLEPGFGNPAEISSDLGNSFENQPSWNMNERILGNRLGCRWETNEPRLENEAEICWSMNQRSAENADMVSWTINEHSLSSPAETYNAQESGFGHCQGTSQNLNEFPVNSTRTCPIVNEFTAKNPGEHSSSIIESGLENEVTFCNVNESSQASRAEASCSVEEGILKYQFGTSWNIREPDLKNCAGSSATMNGCSFENNAETWSMSEPSLENNGGTSWNENDHSLRNPAETSQNGVEGGLLRRYLSECSAESRSVGPTVLKTPSSHTQQSKTSLNEVPYSKHAVPVHAPNGLVKIMTCRYCPKQFSERSEWVNHAAEHFGERPVSFLPCTFCSKLFLSASAFKQHMETHREVGNYNCEGCSKVFTSEKDLTQHLKEVHLDEKPFCCTLCPARFKTEKSLQRHGKLHANKQPFSCTLCPKSFSDSSNLRDHMALHSDERPYSCPLCSRAFKSKGSLNVHVKVTHSSDKPFACNCCSARFKTVFDMQRHLKTHSVDQGFKCSKCPAKFRLDKSLTKHFAKHLAEETGSQGAFQALPNQLGEHSAAASKTSGSSSLNRTETSWITNEGSLSSHSNMNERSFGNREGASLVKNGSSLENLAASNQNLKEVFVVDQFGSSSVTNAVEYHVTIGLNVGECSLETQDANSSIVNKGTFEDVRESISSMNEFSSESRVRASQNGQNVEEGFIENCIGNTVITSEGGYVTIDLDVNESSLESQDVSSKGMNLGTFGN